MKTKIQNLFIALAWLALPVARAGAIHVHDQ